MATGPVRYIYVNNKTHFDITCKLIPMNGSADLVIGSVGPSKDSTFDMKDVQGIHSGGVFSFKVESSTGGSRTYTQTITFDPTSEKRAEYIVEGKITKYDGFMDQ